MSPLIVVATLVAGGLAAVLRYALSIALSRRSKAESFGWTVLTVNTVGSGIEGFLLGLAQVSGATPELQLIILTGVCGGLTTFSTFSVETIQLITSGHGRSAIISIGATLLAGLGACVLGYFLAMA